MVRPILSGESVMKRDRGRITTSTAGTKESTAWNADMANALRR